MPNKLEHLIREINAHLGAAEVQLSDRDDPIIREHVVKAAALSSTALWLVRSGEVTRV
jgi:hypothetical protein